MATLSHPNIVNIFDVDIQDGKPYIVMGFAEGGSLAARLRSGPIGLDEALRLAIPLADALAYAHSQGLIHRDLKPANVLLRPDGSPMLADFGLARSMVVDSAPQITATGAVLDTLAYMAPEQFGGRPTDARADIYAFGVMLYEMLTGRVPFDGAQPASSCRSSRYSTARWARSWGSPVVMPKRPTTRRWLPAPTRDSICKGSSSAARRCAIACSWRAVRRTERRYVRG